MRERLPDRRRTTTQKVKIGGRTLYVNIGFYPDGRPGEVFLDMAKQGTAIRGWANDAALLVSLLLQHGATPGEIAYAIRDMHNELFPAEEVVGCPGIESAAGPLDFLAQLLQKEFCH